MKVERGKYKRLSKLTESKHNGVLKPKNYTSRKRAGNGRNFKTLMRTRGSSEGPQKRMGRGFKGRETENEKRRYLVFWKNGEWRDCKL